MLLKICILKQMLIYLLHDFIYETNIKKYETQSNRDYGH